MDSSGRIHMTYTAEAHADLRRSVGELVAIDEADLTPKQKATMQVSPRDTRSKLGRSLLSLRNKPCPCGSGKKYKKCCGPMGRTREENKP